MRKYNHLLTELILPQKINPSKVKNIKQKKLWSLLYLLDAINKSTFTLFIQAESNPRVMNYATKTKLDKNSI